MPPRPAACFDSSPFLFGWGDAEEEGLIELVGRARALSSFLPVIQLGSTGT